MKRNSQLLKNASCIAAGLFLAHGAQAVVTLVGDTTITFNGSGFANNSQIPTGYGSGASPTNGAVGGVTTGGGGLGLGTPDISLNWQSFSTGRGGQPIQFQYYNGGPWNAAELNNSTAGNANPHEIIFTPTSFASVKITSFNFQSYNNDAETFNYTVSVVDALNPAIVLSTQTLNVPSNAAKDLVTVNVTGALGESLILEITRNSGTGGSFNMALDDLAISELVPEPGTTALLGLGLGGLGIMAIRRWRK